MPVESDVISSGGGPSLSGRPAGGLCPLIGIDSGPASDIATGGAVQLAVADGWPAPTELPAVHEWRTFASQALVDNDFGWSNPTSSTSGPFYGAVTTVGNDWMVWRVGNDVSTRAFFAGRLLFGSAWKDWSATGETPAAAQIVARRLSLEGTTIGTPRNRWGALILVGPGTTRKAVLTHATANIAGDLSLDVADLVATGQLHRWRAWFVARIGFGTTGGLGNLEARVGHLGLEITA